MKRTSALRPVGTGGEEGDAGLCAGSTFALLEEAALVLGGVGLSSSAGCWGTFGASGLGLGSASDSKDKRRCSKLASTGSASLAASLEESFSPLLSCGARAMLPLALETSDSSETFKSGGPALIGCRPADLDLTTVRTAALALETAACGGGDGGGGVGGGGPVLGATILFPASLCCALAPLTAGPDDAGLFAGGPVFLGMMTKALVKAAVAAAGKAFLGATFDCG